MFVASRAIGLSRKIGDGFTFPARNIFPSNSVISCARPTANVGTSILPSRLTASITIRSNSPQYLKMSDDRARHRLTREKEDRLHETVQIRAGLARSAARDRRRKQRA